MKFVVLAASLGYVLGVACTDGGTECDAVATTYCDVPNLVCADKVAGGATCAADGAPCVDTYSCDATSLTCKGADGSACSAAVVADPASATDYEGRCDGDTEDGATATCAAATNAADTVEGCGLVDTEVAQADASVIAVGAVGGLCRAAATASIAIGSTTAAVDAVDCVGTDTCEGEVVGTSDGVCTAAAVVIADGATGGACRTVVDAVPAVANCDVTDPVLDTSTCPGDGAASTDTTTFCGAASITDAAAGADGGACRLVVAGNDGGTTACDGTDVCNGAVVDDAATTDVDETAAGTCGAAATTVAPSDDSPAAIFYGMSMVTAVVAYLL